MRVAIVQEHVDVARGGAETSTVELARHLAAAPGVDVTVLCRGPGDAPRVQDNVTYLPLATGARTRAGATYRFVQGVHRVCRAEAFDIVHAVTPCLCADIYQPRGGVYAAALAGSLARTPPPLRWLRALGRRCNVRQRFLLRIERLLLGKRAARVRVAALSDYVRRQVETRFRLPPEHVRVVFNGVDIAPLGPDEAAGHRAALRAAHALPPDAPLLLFAAHNFRLKGLPELLRAIARAGAADWTLVVAGRDDPRRYRRLAGRLGIGPQVRFVGTATPVRAWYAAADALAHPTWYDPCSRVVLEALALGLPVVTTAENGAAEVMESGRHGEVIARPDDAAALAAALRRALDPAVRAACRAAAPQMHARLSMARHARELLALYAEVPARH